MNEQPCSYVMGVQEKRVPPDGKVVSKAILCGKVCDAGKTMCPRHLLLFGIEQEKKQAKAAKRRESAIRWAKEKKRRKGTTYLPG